MKTKALHRIIALVMSFLMFFTSIGFSVNVHYCKGDLKSFSLIGEAKSCHAAKKVCPQHSKMQLEENNSSDCCSNETIQIDDLDTDFNVAQNPEYTDLEIKFVAAFVYAFNNISIQNVSKTSYLKTHDVLPPRDIYVLLGRFLI